MRHAASESDLVTFQHQLDAHVEVRGNLLSRISSPQNPKIEMPVWTAKLVRRRTDKGALVEDVAANGTVEIGKGGCLVNASFGLDISV